MTGKNDKGLLTGWGWLIFVVASGFFLAFVFNMYVTSDFRQKNIDALSVSDNPHIEGRPELMKREKFTANGRESMLVWSGEKNLELPLALEEAEAQRIRILGYFPKVTYGKTDVTVTVNGRQVKTLSPEWKAGYEKFSFNVGADAFKAGLNTLVLGLDGQNRYIIGYELINFRNYAGKNRNFPKASIQFDENYAKDPKRPFARPLDYLLFPSLLFLLWIAAANLARAYSASSMKAALRRVFYLNLPSAVIVAAFWIYTAATPYTLVIDPLSFFVIISAPCVGLIAYSLLVFAYRRLLALRAGTGIGGLISRLSSVKKTSQAEGILKGAALLKRLARHSGTVAIIAFMVFLGLAGGSMIFKRQDIAEKLADIAYFSLVFGVFMRIFEVRDK